MSIPFYKYQATGNDFVIINDYDSNILADLTQESVRQICDRRFGVGADGLMLIVKSDIAAFKMVYFNSDGRRSTMCGNGGRCIGHLAHSLGLIEKLAQFEAVDGMHELEILPNDQVQLSMKDVLEVLETDQSFVLNTGSPHYVSFRNELKRLNVFEEGQKIRNSAKYKSEGINVNFIEFIDDHLHVRTYERGVEDETYSCGTGVTASAIAFLHSKNLLKEKNHVLICTKGGELSVRFEYDGTYFTQVSLTGPAKNVFQGTIDLLSKD